MTWSLRVEWQLRRTRRQERDPRRDRDSAYRPDSDRTRHQTRASEVQRYIQPGTDVSATHGNTTDGGDSAESSLLNTATAACEWLLHPVLWIAVRSRLLAEHLLKNDQSSCIIEMA